MAVAPGLVRGEDRSVDFARDVQPILAQYCYACHGPDAATREADLRLDQQESVFAKMASGAVPVVPGSVKDSELYRRLVSSNPGEQMPPPDAEHHPSLAEIATLRRWIETGAPWEELWSLQPIRKPRPPTVQEAAWPRNDIDHFVLARLVAEGQRPSSLASKYDWLRRATFDLTGLPPSVEEIKAFVADDSADAEAKVIERLLASPAHGENFATGWLDLARYADTHGYNIDSHRDMWRYREWVIEAFNANMPFDQFTIEQLAGDLLPEPDVNQLTATGFYRNHPINDEEGAFAEEYQHAYVVDRVNTTGTVWLGLTLSCAQCHDHKYDPISQRDYYRLAAYFDNIEEKGLDGRYGNAAPVIKSPTRAQQATMAKLQREQQRLEVEMEHRLKEARPGLEAWIGVTMADPQAARISDEHLVVRETFDALPDKQGPLFLVRDSGEPMLVPGRQGQALLAYGQGYFRLDEDPAEPRTYSLWLYATTTGEAVLYARRTEAGEQLALTQRRGEFHLHAHGPKLTPSIWRGTAADWQANQWHHVAFTLVPGDPAATRVWFDGDPVELLPTEVAEDEREAISAGQWLLGGPENVARFRGLIDEIRIDHQELTREEVQTLAGGNPLADLLAVPAEARTPEQTEKLLAAMLRETSPEFAERERQRDVVRTQQQNLRRQFPETMVMRERNTPPTTHLRLRGEYDQLGEKLTPGLPEQLHDLLPKGPANRLQMAHWLVDERNPLTPRVVVNRIWRHYFGQGLVKTVDDFGTRGELPSHPGLLDYLAHELVASGWDVRHIHRLIVRSATYRQTSRVGREAYQADPENRLLARGPRLRLSAEEIRDQALAASGLLVRKIGGVSVKPYQPPGLWEELSRDEALSAQRYVPDHGERLYRRSLYTYRKRSSPPPNLAAFDAPNREVCLAQRSRTNTPMQALVLLNDATFVEAARVLAEDVLVRPDNDVEAAIGEAFLRVVSRPIEKDELAMLLQLHTAELARFQADPSAAEKLLAVGEAKSQGTVPAAEQAAMTIVCHALLNLDEAIVTP